MVRIISPRANNSCKLIVGPQAEACRTNSKNRARFWTSLRRLRKRQAFTVLIFLVRRFHQPMQFSSRFSVLFHLPRRRLRCAVASRNFQFSKNFRELRSAISVELLREWTTIPQMVPLVLPVQAILPLLSPRRKRRKFGCRPNVWTTKSNSWPSMSPSSAARRSPQLSA